MIHYNSIDFFLYKITVELTLCYYYLRKDKVGVDLFICNNMGACDLDMLQIIRSVEAVLLYNKKEKGT